MNRVIGEPMKVRMGTRQRVMQAAAEIGFYGIETVSRNVLPEGKPFRLTLLLQQPNRWFCEQIAESVRQAKEELTAQTNVRLKVEHLTDLSPELVSDRMNAVAHNSDAVAVVAAEHPLVSETIEGLAKKGIPVYAVISTLSAPSLAGFVGLDSRKVGRTAAWAIHRLCDAPGEIGILLGSHRYRSHEFAESGFRSYFREQELPFRLLEPISTFESDGIAREMTEGMLRDHPDMAGLYLSGGGTKGVLAALREAQRAKRPIAVAYDLTEATRMALLDGTLDIVISHPFAAIGRRTVEMVLANRAGDTSQGRNMTYVGFDLFTSENV